jgi:DNA transformation protein
MAGRVSPMPYWQAPERLFDEPEEFAEWAQRAYEVARRTAKPKARASTARPKTARPKPAR